MVGQQHGFYRNAQKNIFFCSLTKLQASVHSHSVYCKREWSVREGSVNFWIKFNSLGLRAVSYIMLLQTDSVLQFLSLILEQETQMKPELQSGEIYTIYSRELERYSFLISCLNFCR